MVVLSTRPPPIVLPERSAGEISFIINNAETKTARGSRRSSVIGWDTSLEDVQVGRGLSHIMRLLLHYHLFNMLVLFLLGLSVEIVCQHCLNCSSRRMKMMSMRKKTA